MSSKLGELILYTFYRSSCSARVRHALLYKEIPATYRYIDLNANEHYSPDYVALNPAHFVPTLVAEDGVLKLTQSIAILEYLEERYPEKPLLPKDLHNRSVVRSLVNLVSNDIQPVTNRRILNHVEKLGGDHVAWAKEYIQIGLNAYEALVKNYAGLYSVGDEVTMADIVLAPTVEAGLRWGVDFTGIPTVWRIYERLKVLPAFEKGDWRHQEDTPEDLRVKQ